MHTRVALAYQIEAPGADFIFNIQAARTTRQSVVWEQLNIAPYVFSEEHVDPVTHNRMLRLYAPGGPLSVSYQSTVDLRHHVMPPEQVGEVPVAHLPMSVLPYLYPSRYCQSDTLGALVMAQFGHLPRGHSRVRAVVDWVQSQVAFQSNTSHSGTSALETLRDRVGVCRDFAHLAIALCRALNIPARFVTGFDFGADPALGPPDFHAYLEVYLAHRWYLFDPSGTAIPMGLIRIGTGRDAADVAFATILGRFQSEAPQVQMWAEHGGDGGFEEPLRSLAALSTG